MSDIDITEGSATTWQCMPIFILQLQNESFAEIGCGNKNNVAMIKIWFHAIES